MDCFKYQYSFNVKALNDTICNNFLIKYQKSYHSTLRYDLVKLIFVMICFEISNRRQILANDHH